MKGKRGFVPKIWKSVTFCDISKCHNTILNFVTFLGFCHMVCIFFIFLAKPKMSGKRFDIPSFFLHANSEYEGSSQMVFNSYQIIHVWSHKSITSHRFWNHQLYFRILWGEIRMRGGIKFREVCPAAAARPLERTRDMRNVSIKCGQKGVPGLEAKEAPVTTCALTLIWKSRV